MTNEKLNELKSLTSLLDTKFKGPFGFRFGLDGILGLIPVLGDFITGSLSIYIVIQAARFGCPPSTLLRMALNILIENVVDLVPVLGNVFDLIWKANVRNMRILEEYLRHPRKVTWQSRIILGLICFTLIGVIVGSGALTVKLFSALFSILK